MPIQQYWDNTDHTLIHQVFEHGWTLKEMYDAWQGIIALMATVPHTVNIISEVGHIAYLPTNFLSSARAMEQTLPPNYGVHVVISRSMLFRVVTRVGSVLAPRMTARFQFAASLEEAYALVAKVGTADAAAQADSPPAALEAAEH